MEQLPHGDAARHTLVSRFLTKHIYQVTLPNCFFYKNIFLGNVQVFKREIHNRLMTQCSLMVSKRRWFCRKRVCRDLSSYNGWYTLWTRKGRQKKSSRKKVSRG